MLNKLGLKKQPLEDKRTPAEIKRDEKLERIRKRQKNFQRRQLKKKLVWGYLSLVVIIMDQMSKWAVTELLIRPIARTPNKESLDFISWYLKTPSILPYAEIKVFSFFNIVMVWNKGVSFGLLGAWGGVAYLLLVAVALGITGFFCLLLYDSKSPQHSCSYALIIGGALGNIIDRVRFKGVIDFLDFHFAGVHFWAFNVADSAVVCGVVLLGIITLTNENKRRKKLKKFYKERKEKKLQYKNYGR